MEERMNYKCTTFEEYKNKIVSTGRAAKVEPVGTWRSVNASRVRVHCGIDTHRWRVVGAANYLYTGQRNGRCVMCLGEVSRCAYTKPEKKAKAEVKARFGKLGIELVSYTGATTESLFNCNLHGLFSSSFNGMMRAKTKYGCPECAHLFGNHPTSRYDELSELYRAHKTKGELPYNTKGKQESRRMIRECIKEHMGSKKWNLLSMPGGGAEISEILAANMNIDMEHSLGLEINKKHKQILDRLFLKLGWNMPIIYDNIDDIMFNMGLHKERYDVIHADYEGKLTEERIVAMDRALAVSQPGTLLFVTRSANPRGRGDTVECGSVLPVKNGKQVLYTSYKNKSGVMMHVYGILKT
jgi:hypothetical protein